MGGLYVGCGVGDVGGGYCDFVFVLGDGVGCVGCLYCVCDGGDVGCSGGLVGVDVLVECCCVCML